MRTIIVFCLLSTFSYGSDVVVSVGNYEVWNTSSLLTIPVMVASPSQQLIPGLDLAVQIGDGGPVNLGTDTISVLDLDIIGLGTLFYLNNVGDWPTILDGIGINSTITDSWGPNVEANGILGFLTLSPYQAKRGTYVIKCHDVTAKRDTNVVWNTDFADLETPEIQPSFIDGGITVLAYYDLTWDGTWSSSDNGPIEFTPQASLFINSPLEIESLEVKSIIVNSTLTTNSIIADTLTIGSNVVTVPEPGSNFVMICMLFGILWFMKGTWDE